MCTAPDTILSQSTIKALIGSRCDGVVGQLTEKWDAQLFGALRAAGGSAYSNYAVGYDNVVVPDATAAGVAVGNTPGAPQRQRRRVSSGWRRRAPAACGSAPVRPLTRHRHAAPQACSRRRRRRRLPR